MFDVLDVVRELGDELVDELPPGALADNHEPRLGQLSDDETPRRHQPVDVLVGLEHPDEERRRLLRERSNGLGGEGREIDVRHERGSHGMPRTSSTRPSVKLERPRTASPRRSAIRPTASASGDRTRREGDPYIRVAVRQSP